MGAQNGQIWMATDLIGIKPDVAPNGGYRACRAAPLSRTVTPACLACYGCTPAETALRGRARGQCGGRRAGGPAGQAASRRIRADIPHAKPMTVSGKRVDTAGKRPRILAA
jgi:hypothetical protein